MRLLYSALYYLLLPFILLRLLWRSRKAPAYRHRMAERLGLFAPPADNTRPAIWLHAVSVGETVAAKPLIEHLLAQYPQHSIVVTTTTPTGSERVQHLFGDRVFHVYAPWDIPTAVARFFNRIQPQVLLIMETELWPNMLHQAQCRQVPVLLANARLSARSAKGYGRIAGLTKPMLQSLQRLACQSNEDAERLLALGAPPSAIRVTGSIKFDIQLGEVLRQQAAQLRTDWRAEQRPIIVAASTHPGEDEIILDAFSKVKQQFTDALLVLVPRHPERFNAVAQQCEAQHGPLSRRSHNRPPSNEQTVLLGDTMGELLLLLSTARIAIIGGSLVAHGGHNVLEAAAWGVPVITGPWMFNFAQISELMTDAGAMLQLDSPDQLADSLCELLADDSRRQQMGKAGLTVINANRGAQAKLEALVDETITGAHSAAQPTTVL